jgi:hypothetical protein
MLPFPKGRKQNTLVSVKHHTIGAFFMANPFVKAECEVIFDQDLDPISKFVLISLRYWDRGTGNGCFAKKTTIASMLNISLHQLRVALVKLEEAGAIVIHKRGQGNTDVIRVVEETETQEFKNIEVSSNIIRSKKEEVDIASSLESDEETDTACIETDTDSETLETGENTKPLTIDHQAGIQKVVSQYRWDLYFQTARISSEDEISLSILMPSEVSADFIRRIYGQEFDQIFHKKVYFTWR